jgi:hypothetical protein
MPLHRSPAVQALPSLHGVTVELGGFWQPSVALHESVVHWFVSTQFIGVPGRQLPVRHTSTPLQTLLSVHEVSSGTGRLRQPRVASQESVVQTFVSMQFWV